MLEDFSRTDGRSKFRIREVPSKLHSTGAVDSRRVPDVRVRFLGSARAAVAGASGSAAYAGRPRDQAPLDAGRWADNPPRAPPAAALSRTRPRAGNDAGPMWRIGPANQRPLPVSK